VEAMEPICSCGDLNHSQYQQHQDEEISREQEACLLCFTLKWLLPRACCLHRGRGEQCDFTNACSPVSPDCAVHRVGNWVLKAAIGCCVQQLGDGFW
jgi:hypothetical protein